MKIIVFVPKSPAAGTTHEPSCGFITESGVFRVGAHDGKTLRSLLSKPAGLKSLLASSANRPPDFLLSDIEICPPLDVDTKVICVGLNYRAHVEETGRKPNDKPTLFSRWPDTHVGHNTPLIKPSASERFDFEGEIAIVIGKNGRHIGKEEAFSHVAGYTCYNDGSIRDWQRHSTQFMPGKNFFGSGSIGPWIVTSDEIADPGSMSVTTRLNGDVVQHGNITQLIFDVPELIAYISIFTPLSAGDIIATGTPEGVGMARTPPLWMAVGDHVEVEVSGVGTLHNSIVAE